VQKNISEIGVLSLLARVQVTSSVVALQPVVASAKRERRKHMRKEKKKMRGIEDDGNDPLGSGR